MEEELETAFLEKVSYEGLGYALAHCFGENPEEISHDREFTTLWNEAQSKLSALEAYIEKRMQELGVEEI